MAFQYSGSGDPDAKATFKLMEAGKTYQMNITNAEESVSKKGNQMLVITLEPTNPEFSSRELKQYIVVNEFWDNNIARLRQSAGKDHGTAASFEAHQIVGWIVYGEIKHEDYIKKDKTKGTSDKIAFFRKPPEKAEEEPTVLPEKVEGEAPVNQSDVPF